jgi:DNA-binding MarR family transcriptional regulator
MAPPPAKSPLYDSTPPAALPYRMRLLVQMMERQFQELLNPFGITPLHWGVLCCLWRKDGQAAQEIAQMLEQLPGTLTVGFAAMERRGLITRRPDRDDGRVSRVCLTPAGRKLEARLKPRVDSFVRAMFGGVSASEYRTLVRLTAKLKRHLDQDGCSRLLL